MVAIGSYAIVVLFFAISFNGQGFHKIEKWFTIHVTSFFFFFLQKQTADRYNRLVCPWEATQLKYISIFCNEIFLWAVFLFV